MAKADLEQIAIAMMMMAGEPERPTGKLHHVNGSAAASSGTKKTLAQNKRYETANCFSSADDNEDENNRDAKLSLLRALDLNYVKTENDTRRMLSDGEGSHVFEQEDISNKEGPDELSDEAINYSCTANGGTKARYPNSTTPSPPSPAGSLSNNGSHSSGGGGCSSGATNAPANSVTRRIFTPEFKQSVLDAFTTDPECVGNQRATARKFGIHRRQVQKWLQQITDVKDHHSDEVRGEDADSSKKLETRPKVFKHSSSVANKNNRNCSLSGSRKSGSLNGNSEKLATSTMPIIAGKITNHSPSAANASSTKLNLAKNNFSSPMNNFFMDLGFMNSGGSPILSLPFPVENSRHSPRVSPDSNNRTPDGSLYMQNGQPPTTTQDIVDELCYLYPNSDFSLLRNALLKNEITLTKLSPPRKSHSSTSLNNMSPSPKSSDYMTQQTLQLLKQQNDYVQLLQKSGINLPVFSNELGNNMSDSGSKYGPWYHPLAQAAVAAAAGLPISSFTNGTDRSNGKKRLPEYPFASPKVPFNHKPKTVAAVLAATRENPGSSNNPNGNHHINKQRKPVSSSQRRRPNKLPKPSTITRPSREDEFLDPTSMLEVTTNAHEEFGMDLTTTAPSIHTTSVTTMSTNNQSKSPAEVTSPYKTSVITSSHTGGHSAEIMNGHVFPGTMGLENFVQSVLPSRSKSPDSESDRSKTMVLDAFNYDAEVAGDARGVARKFGLNIRVVMKWLREGPSKSLPFIPTAEFKGSKPANGLNILSMMIPDNSDESADLTIKCNGLSPNEDMNHNNGNNNGNRAKSLLAHTQPNKRKNSKPNQICDFTEDLSGIGPLDMVVPIKKRRLSTPTPQ